MTTQTTLPTAPIAAMFTALADSQPDGPVRAAFATVRDAIDMDVLPPEVLTEVVLGRRTIAQAMADLADVQADSLADDVGMDPETIGEVESFIIDCRAAASALTSMTADA